LFRLTRHGGVIETEGDGYRLRVADDQPDVYRQGRAMLAEMSIRELAHHVGSAVAPAETRP
jgi:hypothetical protein